MNVHGNVHTAAADWANDWMNEVLTACLLSRRRAIGRDTDGPVWLPARTSDRSPSFCSCVTVANR